MAATDGKMPTTERVMKGKFYMKFHVNLNKFMFFIFETWYIKIILIHVL